MKPIRYKKPKDKTCAVLLAVFLGTWAWVYTWNKDKTKWLTTFFIILGLSITIIGIPLAIILDIGFHIWAIVDTATKPNEWYRKYEVVYV